MKNLSLDLVRGQLSRSQMRNVIGGNFISPGNDQGSCGTTCNSGVYIGAMPDCSTANQEWACTNQDGPRICSCLN